MTLGETVARNLFAVRKQKKLSQVILAKKAKISVSYVSMLERGQRTPPLETLEVIAKALGVPPLHLLKEVPASSARKRKR